MDASDMLGVLRRSGLLDPLRGSAVAVGLGRWGPSLAAGATAGALRTPFGTAVIDEHGRLTWSQLDRRTTRLARGIHGIGAGRGATAGILCRNGVGFVVAAIATAKAGLTPVLLNTGSSAAQLEEILGRESVDLLLVDDDRADEFSGIDFDGRIVTVSSFDRLEVMGRRRIDPLVPKIAAPVLMTSGTTGTPKGARRSMRPNSAGAGILGLIPYRSDDVFVVPAPLFHAWGFSNLALALTLGATTVAIDRFTPAAVVEAVANYDGTVLVAVPVMLKRLLVEPELDLAPLRRLRIAGSSGSALPAALAIEWMDRTGDNLYNLYGSTEVGSATIATPDDLRAAPGTAGRLIPGCDVRVLDHAGVAVEPGVTGRLFVAGGGAFDGYSGGGGKAVIAGAMATGDIGSFDSDGRLFISGRADDMIVSGGENVFPGSVEAVLLAEPGVIDAAVVGVDDDDFGQRLCAYVHLADNAAPSEQDLRDAVKRKLGRHYAPRDVVFVDTIPRNRAGKVLRRLLGGQRAGTCSPVSPGCRSRSRRPDPSTRPVGEHHTGQFA